jgi:hypothetical protein
VEREGMKIGNASSLESGAMPDQPTIRKVKVYRQLKRVSKRSTGELHEKLLLNSHSRALHQRCANCDQMRRYQNDLLAEQIILVSTSVWLVDGEQVENRSDGLEVDESAHC